MYSPIALLALTAGLSAVLAEHIVYSTVPGFFLQDLNTTNASTFDYTATNFGLINQTYPTDSHFDPHGKKTQWQRFAHYVREQVFRAPKNVDYKVIFFGRHGQGFHNAAESYYGTPAWNCYWSERDGNSTVIWADAHLTSTGVAQAQKAHDFWAYELEVQKIPAPQTYYTSPLYRCLATANITFDGLKLPRSRPFVPLMKELLRESISGHTCDRRSNKTYIHANFPSYKIEKGFSEQDLLWKPLEGETSIDQQIRSKTVLDQVFTSDRSTWISVTSHSGEIGAILTGEPANDIMAIADISDLGHIPFSLNTGSVIPVFIKAETVKGAQPTTSTQPYTALSTCSTQPPLPTGTS